ncbi:MAG: ketopantoate reductase family protein [Lachnospiraceae bacterium]|nr:ketopantoate reductase family protein [Lachnospiraceae bacterium]
MRLLIYGAGVIGCLYAALFSEAGYDTYVYARGKRLESLTKNGLLYRKDKKIRKATVKIIDKVEANDIYDFIFLPVREHQVHDALKELSYNGSPNIVTMVNTLEPYCGWENICGKGRIIPAFPGAGGSFDGNVLCAALTPRMIQPTVFSEIDGEMTERISVLAGLFKHAKIPYQIVRDMHAWQLCHLAMVVPIADAYYKADEPEKAGRERKVMISTAKRLRHNFSLLHELGIPLSPSKMNVFRFLPISILSTGLGVVFQSKFGNMFMYQHSMKAPDEMRQLHIYFYRYIKQAGNRLR